MLAKFEPRRSNSVCISKFKVGQVYQLITFNNNKTEVRAYKVKYISVFNHFFNFFILEEGTEHYMALRTSDYIDDWVIRYIS